MAATATAGGILIVGDSTVDWFIAEPTRDGREGAEVRFVWSLTDGPGLSCIAGGAALDCSVLTRAAELAGSAVSVRGPVIPVEILDSPTTSSVTRSFSSWAPMPRTVGAKQ